MGNRVVMAESSDIYYDYRVQKEANSLAQAGYQVSVYGFRATFRPPAGQDFLFRLRTFPVISRKYRFWRNLSMVWNILIINLVVLLTRAEYYHAHNTMFLVGMYLGAKLHGGRFVYDAHEVQWEHGRAQAWLESWFIGRADGVIVVSAGRGRASAERYGLPVERFTVVSNFPVVDPGSFAAADDRPQSTLRLIFSGGYDLRNNRLDLLLEGMQRVPGVELFLLAFGYRDSELRLRDLIDRLGLADRVHFLPLVAPSEVMRVVARYDVAVNLLTNPFNHVSIRFCSTNKMYEYLAAGLPTLCSDLEAFVEEFVRPGAAIAVDAEDVDSIAAGLERLVGNPDALGEMKTVARELSRTRYNWCTQEEVLLQLYGAIG